MKDKRYLLFGFSTYYPCGGLYDMIGSYDTIPEAVEKLKEDYSEYHTIYDRIQGTVIDLEPYGINE